MPSYTTVAGETIKSVKIGWEAAGTLKADKSNAVLIAQYFSGTSHAFGKYAASDKAVGYWDAIIGPAKTIDISFCGNAERLSDALSFGYEATPLTGRMAR